MTQQTEPVAVRFGMSDGAEKFVLGRSMDEILKDVTPTGPINQADVMTMEVIPLDEVRKIFDSHIVELGYECVKDQERQGRYYLGRI